MRLEDYRKLRGLTREEAAGQLDADPATIWRWETGKATPRPVQMKAIKVWSKGAVTADDLVGDGVRS